MAKRTFRLGPDTQSYTLSGQAVPTLSREKLFEGVKDALIMADRAGGVVTVMLGRAESGLEGEMFTSEAIVNWMDRTDARPQREEPVAFEPSHPLRLLVGEEEVDGELVEDPDELSPEAVEQGMADEGRF